jgi:hypothetical protein
MFLIANNILKNMSSHTHHDISKSPRHDKYPTPTFSGLPPDHPFDKYYSSTPSDIVNRVFNGFTGTRIFFDTNSNSWKIVLIDNPNNYAEMVSSTQRQNQIVPLGTNHFNFSTKLGRDQFSINMNVCNDEKEYNCQDGTCIPIYER